MLRKESAQERFVKRHFTTLRDRTGRATKIPWEEITQGLGEHIKHREATGLQQDVTLCQGHDWSSITGGLCPPNHPARAPTAPHTS